MEETLTFSFGDRTSITSYAETATALAKLLAIVASQSGTQFVVVGPAAIRIAAEGASNETIAAIQLCGQVAEYIVGKTDRLDPDLIPAAAKFVARLSANPVPITLDMPSGALALQSHHLVATSTANRKSMPPEYGAVEGKIEMVDTSEGLHCRVYDTFSGGRIRCRLDQEQEDRMWKLGGKGARLEGWIECDLDSGRPKAMLQVADFEEVPAPRPLRRTPTKLRGFTQGAEDILKEFRDEK